MKYDKNGVLYQPVKNILIYLSTLGKQLDYETNDRCCLESHLEYLFNKKSHNLNCVSLREQMVTGKIIFYFCLIIFQIVIP